jgi:hypothetical protein
MLSLKRLGGIGYGCQMLQFMTGLGQFAPSQALEKYDLIAPDNRHRRVHGRS